MKRDEARARWGDAGLSYARITDESLQDLRDRVDTALRTSDLIEDYRADPAPRVRSIGDATFAAITCSSFYFTDREAVTFNRDGFIGFAGWADDTNVQPILEAFCSWVDALQPGLAIPAP